MKTYSQLAVATTADVANERINAFFKDLGELRQKHEIPDVHVVVRSNILSDGGREASGLCPIHYGDQSHALQMCSYAMGHAQGEHQKFILAARAEGMKLGAEIALKEVEKRNNDLFKD